jgi:CDAN1-interacting nuclease 1
MKKSLLVYKMVIVSEKIWSQIVDFLRNFKGLSIECDEKLVQAFPEIPFSTLRSIQSKYGQNLIKEFYSKKHKNFSSILMEYERRVRNEWTIIEMSLEVKVPPLSICRMILNEKFSKGEVKEMIKNPDLIPDPLLSANVL